MAKAQQSNLAATVARPHHIVPLGGSRGTLPTLDGQPAGDAPWDAFGRPKLGGLSDSKGGAAEEK